ncbi:MAG: cytochrome c oxidase subunit I [Chloroflexota bacterium]|nr:cytochrome c oxidase subunit I [Chloroflexota bacterium]
MAVVTAPVQHGGMVVAPPTIVAPAYRGLWSWLTTVDHKRIGILYGVSAGTFFVLGGIEALVIRLQLWVPSNNLVSAQMFNALFTMHATTMIFLAIMPLGAAFFNFIIPLQIGARDVAFPRLNAFSYWAFILGGILLNVSFLLGGAPDAGWFGYAPLTTRPYSPGPGIDFCMMGLQVLGVASLAAALNFFVTILNMRAPGLSFMRLPIFCWMSLITMVLLLLAFPSITVGLILLMFDRFFETNFYIAPHGGDPILWQHLFWVFGHPEVYILILPAMGVVSEIIPVFSRKPLFGYAVMVYSGLAIAFLSFGVWAHHMFAVGLGPLADAVFASTTMLIAVPTGVKIFNWIGTMHRGSLNFATPMLFAVGFIAMFIIGGVTGIMHASPPADLIQHDTYFIVAHIHYVLIGGSIMALFAGIYYWFPKMSGRMLNETLGKWNFWTFFLFFNLTFMPMHWTGLLGMPRRVHTYGPELGVTGLNQMSTVGAIGLGFSVLIFIVNLFLSLRTGKPAPDDPWDGATLEWSIPSPPPVYNFARIPTVHSRDAWWAMKHPERMHLDPMEVEPVAGGPAHATERAHEVVQTTAVAEAPAVIHMPSPSFWPLLAALGLAIMATGLLVADHIGPLAIPIFAITGVSVLLASIYGWSFEPA